MRRNPLVIATRGSKLARAQAGIVAALLTRAHPGIEVETLVVTTKGDADRRPFSAIGGKGLFVAEVERAVADGAADIAVHSAKDLTAVPAAGCRIVCVPARGPVHDVVVTPEGAPGGLESLAPGARVGTSSLRRRTLVAEARGDLELAELRGNLDTRLRKVAAGEVAAAVLAAAGIERLGTWAAGTDAGVSISALDPGWWVPAPGQGALAVEARADRADVAELLEPLNDAVAAAELACERAFAATLEGGCSVPLGCLARVSAGTLVATGYLGSPYGGKGLRDRVSGGIDEASDLGRELAHAILAAGGDDVLADIRADAPPAPDAP